MLASKPSIDNTVVDYPTWQERGGLSRLILSVMSNADDIPPWSTVPHQRDTLLREFSRSEPLLASAIYSVTARNAGFKWEVVAEDPGGPSMKTTVNRITRMLQQSDRGNGWIVFLTKLYTDLYSQDNGAFMELIRVDNHRPDSPVINIAHLDAAQCVRTGDPRVPVIYTNRLGHEIPLAWWQVRTLSEISSPVEDAYGIQVCAVSRALLAAQILKDVSVYKREKVSGNFARRIYFVSGVSNNEIDDGLAWHKEQVMNMNLLRYSQPVIIPGIDPASRVSVESIDLASLPDAWDEDSTMKWYIAQLAMAFGVDYQEFAPLPGGNLGSSQQSQILHLKTQGKGPALVMSHLEYILNNSRILPRTVRFQFKEHDLRNEVDQANIAFTRSKDISMRMAAGVLDPEGALDLQVWAGDIPEHIAREVKARGLAQRLYESRLQTNNVSSGQIMGGITSDLYNGDGDSA